MNNYLIMGTIGVGTWAATHIPAQAMYYLFKACKY